MAPFQLDISINHYPMIPMKPADQPDFTLRDLLEEQVRDLYDAESSYLEFIFRVSDHLVYPELRVNVDDIAIATRENVDRLVEVCEILGVPPTGVVCAAMEGLISEAKAHTKEYESGSVMEASFVASAQRIVHYEIAGFGTGKAFAKKLGLTDVEKIFNEMLNQSISIDKQLTKTATGSWFSEGINDLAATGSTE